jgi:quercetin dioxygenase-like cupin family protein
MQRQWILALATALVAHPSHAQDAVATDGDKYKVLLENACVRVLDYQDAPGQRTHAHHHPPFVLYALVPFERDIHLPDGKVVHRKFKQGDVLWSPAQTHTGENTGNTPTHALLVEAKPSGASDPACKGASTP